MAAAAEASAAKEGDTSTKVKRQQVEKAVTSLKKWFDSQKTTANAQLFDNDDMFYVVLTLKKTPASATTNGYQIALPHSLYPREARREVCLIVKDSKEEGHKAAKERILQEGDTGVTKVIGVQKLRTKYKPYEAKRQLCGSYDLFLADDRVIPLLPRLLGKTFFKKKKHPIPVNLRGKKWSEKIRKACDATYLYVREGPCCVLRAARVTQSEKEVVENIMAVIIGAAEHVPRKWKNIQSIYLKTQESASLPIYTVLPDAPFKISSQMPKAAS